jgi:hypothetical protein
MKESEDFDKSVEDGIEEENLINKEVPANGKTLTLAERKNIKRPDNWDTAPTEEKMLYADKLRKIYHNGSNPEYLEVFKGDKYKNSEIFNGERRLCLGRTSSHSAAVLLMLCEKDDQGNPKYTYDDILDNTKFLKEKQKYFDEVVQRSLRGNAEDRKFLMNALYNGLKEAARRQDELAEKINVDDENFEYDETFIKMMSLSQIAFDCWQDLDASFQNEYTELVNKDCPEITTFEDAHDYTENLAGSPCRWRTYFDGILDNNLYTDDELEKNNSFAEVTKIKCSYVTFATKMAYAKHAMREFKENGNGQSFTEYCYKKRVLDKTKIVKSDPDFEYEVGYYGRGKKEFNKLIKDGTFYNALTFKPDPLEVIKVDNFPYLEDDKKIKFPKNPKKKISATKTKAKSKSKRGAEGTTAAEFIEEIKAAGFPNKNPRTLLEDEKNAYTEKFLKIIAARQIADSDRGYRDKLDSTVLDMKELNKRVNAMKEDSVFSGFIDELKNDPSKMKKAIAAATTGHGGGLDDMLKDYVKNIGPAEMKNSHLHKRFLPTIKERIEILKKKTEQAFKAKKKPAAANSKEADFDYYKAAAEIIVLRNYAKADIGKKDSLNKPIPTFEKSKLDVNAYKVGEENDFKELVDIEDVKKLIVVGHGGNMTKLMREKAKDNIISDDVKDLLNENTIKNRFSTIQDEAGTQACKLRKALEDNSQNTADLAKEGKILIAEYLLLAASIRNSKTRKMDDNLLIKDVPWGEVNEVRRKGANYNSEIKGILKNFKPDDICEALESMANDSRKLFLSKIKNKSEELGRSKTNKKSGAVVKNTSKKSNHDPALP